MSLKGYIYPRKGTIKRAAKLFTDGTLVYINAIELTSLQFGTDGELISLNYIPLEDIVAISIFKD